jgi:hypothetical protein
MGEKNAWRLVFTRLALPTIKSTLVFILDNLVNYDLS